MKESQEEVLTLYKTLLNLHLKLVSDTYNKINPNLTRELAINSKQLRIYYRISINFIKLMKVGCNMGKVGRKKKNIQRMK